jgi:hypothetical protein
MVTDLPTQDKPSFPTQRKKPWYSPTVVLIGVSLRDGHECRNYCAVKSGTRLGSITGLGLGGGR